MSSKLGKGKHDHYTKLFSFIQIFEWKSSSQSTEHSSKRIYRGLLICRETAVLWIGFLYFLFFLPKKTDSWQHCSVRKLPLFSSWMKILEFFLIYIISSRQIENVMKIFLKSPFIRVLNWHFQVFITRLSGNHFWAVPNTRIQYDTRKRFCKRLDTILHGRPYPVESFDLFYSFIHSLNDEELFILFGSHITFVWHHMQFFHVKNW